MERGREEERENGAYVFYPVLPSSTFLIPYSSFLFSSFRQNLNIPFILFYSVPILLHSTPLQTLLYTSTLFHSMNSL